MNYVLREMRQLKPGDHVKVGTDASLKEMSHLRIAEIAEGKQLMVAEFTDGCSLSGTAQSRVEVASETADEQDAPDYWKTNIRLLLTKKYSVEVGELPRKIYSGMQEAFERAAEFARSQNEMCFTFQTSDTSERVQYVWELDSFGDVGWRLAQWDDFTYPESSFMEALAKL